jgi:pyruvate kinase
MRNTKIIATVGPATSDPAVLDQLVAAGVDVFRLNFSHGTAESHQAVCRGVREAARRQGRHVAVLQDLSGPKIRTGPVAGGGALLLDDGDALSIVPGDEPGEPGRIFTPYAELVSSARPGERLLLDDGRIELRVVESLPRELGRWSSTAACSEGRKGINAPGVTLPASAITREGRGRPALRTRDGRRSRGAQLRADGRGRPARAAIVMDEGSARAAHREDRAAGGRAEPRRDPRGRAGCDGGARRPRARDAARAGAARAEADHPAGARAGKPRHRRDAGPGIDAVRAAAHPRRGERCRQRRGEGTDAIMLSGETAVGQFPVRAVETLDRIIREAESAGDPERIEPERDPTGSLHGRALCEAAVTLSTMSQADAIVAVTREGRTARLLSSLRPRYADLRRDRHRAGGRPAGARVGCHARADGTVRDEEALGG